MNLLWKEITKDTNPGPWPSSFALGGIFIEDLTVSFNETGDVFPNKREKLIHSVGAIAKAKWVALDNKYSGILKNGCKNLLIRLSVAKQPDEKKIQAIKALDNFVPGFSFKCLRNGIPSANLQAMDSVGGQTSWNFFKKDFSHLIPFPDEDKVAFSGGLLAGKFSSVTPFIGNVGLKDLAAAGDDGKSVTPSFPFKIIFRANPDYQKKFTDDFKETYLTQLKGLPTGLLYDIFSLDKPGCKEQKIGSIEITTQFTTSKFSDVNLFFRHNTAEGDMEGANSSWKDYKDKASWHIIGGISIERAKAYPKNVSGCPVLRMMNKLKKLF